MKKIIVAAMALFAAVSIQNVTLAASVGIKTDNASVSYTYLSDDDVVFNIDKLFGRLSEASAEEGITDTLVITSNAEDEGGIEVFLRLELESDSDAWTYSPLDYYSFTISDESDSVIYASDDADLSAVTDTTKDISLGIFNKELVEDIKSYKIEYKISEEGAKLLSPEDVSDLKISLVMNMESEEEVIAAPTQRPKFEISSSDSENETNKVENNPTAAPATDTPSGETETEKPVKEKKLVCGTDIDAGRYVVKGNGVVKVESALGESESAVTLNDGSVEGVEGEPSAIITLSDGDVITLIPLEGQEKATVSLEKTNSGTSASGNSAVRNNVTNKAESGKTNPKTGEESTVALWILMAAAVIGISAVEIIKRKKVK